MTSPTLSRIRQAQSRRVHLVMRNGAMIEGNILVGEDQALVPFLNGRRGGWMNVNRAHRPKLNEPPAYMIVQSDHVILASAPDGDVQIATIPSTGVEERNVEITLIGGRVVLGFVAAAAKQRLSDYIAAQTGRFMGLQRATLAPDGRALGDVALHIGAIEFIRDRSDAAPIEESPSIPESTS